MRYSCVSLGMATRVRGFENARLRIADELRTGECAPSLAAPSLESDLLTNEGQDRRLGHNQIVLTLKADFNGGLPEE